MPAPRPEPRSPDDMRGLDALERSAPWIVVVLVVVLVVLSIVSAILGAPWWA